MKRLLILSYYFPPSGGPGVQRVLKFVRYLPEFGWMPTVVTVDPQHAAYPDVDEQLTEEIPAAVDVYRTRSWDPYAMYARVMGREKSTSVGVGFLGEDQSDVRHRISRWIRANIFLPDARVGWVPFAYARSLQIANEQNFDAILTSGPPHSTHLSGLLLARKTGLPWIADFRDPWTEIDFYDELPMTMMARRLDASLERAVLRRVDGLTVVGPSMRRLYEPRTSIDIATIFNGFDERDFTKVEAKTSSTFEILHVGNMNAARNPHALWDALGEIRAPETMPELRIRLIGNVDPAVERSYSAAGLVEIVETMAYVPHEEAVRQIAAAPVLLLAINHVRGAEGILTGKLYEYLASRGSVLGIGPPTGDAAAVIDQTGAGAMYGFEDASGIASFIQRAYDAWKEGRAIRSHASTPVESFSRREQTRRLAAYLDSSVDAAGAHDHAG